MKTRDRFVRKNLFVFFLLFLLVNFHLNFIQIFQLMKKLININEKPLQKALIFISLIS